jgi:MerR family transcriptional regulator, redox-sensitive transcriptional activator SoxR
MAVPALTIAELSARSGAAPSALRYYEDLGLIRAGRTSGNQRRYPRHTLRRVAFIRPGRRRGPPRIGRAVAARRRAPRRR